MKDTLEKSHVYFYILSYDCFENVTIIYTVSILFQDGSFLYKTDIENSNSLNKNGHSLSNVPDSWTPLHIYAICVCIFLNFAWITNILAEKELYNMGTWQKNLTEKSRSPLEEATI